MQLTPVDYDPFSGSGANGGDPLRITVTPQGREPKLTPVDHDPFAGTGAAEDVAKSIPSGLGKGGIALAGLPGDVRSLLLKGIEGVHGFAINKLGYSPEEAKKLKDNLHNAIEFSVNGTMPDGTKALDFSRAPTSSEVRTAVEKKTGPLYEPKTTPGKFTGKVAEFIPGALIGGGGTARNLVNLAVAPGVADEATRELTKGTSAESWAPTVAAVVTGGGASVLNRPASADRAIRGAMSPQVNQATITQAERLMQDAQQRGVQLTWAEAVEQIAPGSGLTNMQRILESSPGSREVIAPVMARRPAQVENAARQTFDTVAPRNAAPSNIGPAVGRAAEGTVNDVRDAINATARPFYDRASTVLMTPAEMRPIRAAPGWQEARDAVRNDPQLNRYVRHLPEDSVGFLNEVKKYLDTAATNAGAPVNAQRNMQRSAGYGSDATTVRNAAVNATLGNPARNYETALAIETHGRERFLQPLLDGPLGKIASKDTTTKNAIDALFPANPLPNSQNEITTAVGALVARNQRAARDLVRAHAEATFNEAAQALQGGANQFGGAKFAKEIAGNPQQRANLEAAVRELPNGDQVWAGFNRFLEIAQATGTRQQIGSKTAFNAQELKDLSTGGLVGNAVKTGTSPGRWLTVINDAWSRWQLGRNLDQIAHILTDPASAGRLRAIAARPQGNEAVSLVGQLITTAQTSRQGNAHNQ